jgi:hypothetical protein
VSSLRGFGNQAPRRGQRVVVGALLLYFVALGCLMRSVGWTEAWSRFRVASLHHKFQDMAALTSGWECSRRGFEIVGRASCEHGVTPFNYPRMWLWFGFLGFGREATTYLAVAAGILALTAIVFVVARALTRGEGALLALAVISPPVMLAFERGNIDLFVFTLVVLGTAGVAASQDRWLPPAGAALLMAACLKLFPIFALAAAFGRGSRARIALGIGVLSTFAVYVVLTLNDIRLINASTPRNTVDSFGAAVGPDLAKGSLGLDAQMTFFATVASVVAAVGLALAFSQSWRPRSPSEPPSRRRLALFQVGAGIFVGTFLLGHNYDYRLIFLILTVPALAGFALRDGLPVARATLATMLTYLWLKELVPVAEALDWMLFVLFLSALLSTLPQTFFALLDPGRAPRRASTASSSPAA